MAFGRKRAQILRMVTPVEIGTREGSSGRGEWLRQAFALKRKTTIMAYGPSELTQRKPLAVGIDIMLGAFVAVTGEVRHGLDNPMNIVYRDSCRFS
jgi:hypothetical protein